MAGGKHILGKSHARRVFGTARVGDRGQIVIPKEAREMFGIQPGDTLLILGETEAGLIISRPEALNDLADKLLNNINKEE
jgi:AbrB family looped-hinge helix DNA binding protein